MKRYATLQNARSRREAEAYLPDNYEIIHEFGGFYINRISGETEHVMSQSVSYVIAGEDVAGWTLDDYVIPRCATGLIRVDEIDLSHPVMKEITV